MGEHVNASVTIEVYNILTEDDFADVLIDTLLTRSIADFIYRYFAYSEEEEGKKVLTNKEFINLKSIDKTFECGICLEEQKIGKELNCEHVFCENCIKSWLTTYNNTCPSCRKEVVI